jgi:hypothetical protein
MVITKSKNLIIYGGDNNFNDAPDFKQYGDMWTIDVSQGKVLTLTLRTRRPNEMVVANSMARWSRAFCRTHNDDDRR